MTLSPDLPIPPGHKLFLVQVMATASSEKEVLVMAEDATTARGIARREVEFSALDLEDWTIDACSRVVQPQEVTDSDFLGNEAYICWPVGSRRDMEVNTRELLDLLLTPDAEVAGRLRMARIEATSNARPL